MQTTESPMKALGFREDQATVTAKVEELYGESPVCDHCSLEIVGKDKADALYWYAQLYGLKEGR